MNILKYGSKILIKIFEEFGVTEITDLQLLDKFLDRLLTETKGLIIFDFLDAGCWDRFGSYSIDYENEYVFFNWHSYSGKNDLQSYVEKLDYKPSIQTIMLHFKDMKIVNLKNFPFVTLRGYSMQEKEILKYFKKDNNDALYFKKEKANFSNQFYIDRGKYEEYCYCHDTPIYSIIIIPKDTARNRGVSMKLLFLYNYENCRERIQKVAKSLLSNNLDEDELCQKANAIRRIFEFVLKIQ